MEETEKLVKAVPSKLLRPLLSLAVMVLAYLLWENYRPERMLQPVERSIKALQTDMVGLHRQVDTIAVRQSVRAAETDAMQRWMCFQNRTDAVKAGIACKRLLEE